MRAHMCIVSAHVLNLLHPPFTTFTTSRVMRVTSKWLQGFHHYQHDRQLRTVTEYAYVKDVSSGRSGPTWFIPTCRKGIMCTPQVKYVSAHNSCFCTAHEVRLFELRVSLGLVTDALAVWRTLMVFFVFCCCWYNPPSFWCTPYFGPRRNPIFVRICSCFFNFQTA